MQLPYAGRNRAVDADLCVSFQEGHASRRVVFQGAVRLHHGLVQYSGAVAWPGTR